MRCFLSGELKPIVFLLGPSGSGKSTLASWVQEDLGYLHVEIDRANGYGIDIEGLRIQWDKFRENNQPAEFAAEIRRRIAVAQKCGTILSFPSGDAFSLANIISAREHGIFVAVLYGTGAECLAAFLRREAELERGFSAKHWVDNNAYSYACFSLPFYEQCRIMAFERGKHRERKALVQEIAQLITP